MTFDKPELGVGSVRKTLVRRSMQRLKRALEWRSCRRRRGGKGERRTSCNIGGHEVK